ncbi:MAG TPA: GntR family transcriptional regulator [Pseudothermotoga sp.]|nr:GntR family transcriptional regulator [Pseudothermotoga sp.]HOK84015.1 GntR family transcriptional regulator [Pseudothermotoga sp.]HPP70481.1 GntR family transcriptional regulator [Pseudothermotoga sp.]
MKNKPMYMIVKEYILSKIKKGELSPEDRIPSEKELMDLFQVSRITVRKAIDELSVEGYIYRLQGIGAFVQKPLPKTQAVSSKLIGVFLTTASDVLSVGILRGLEEYLSTLGFHPVVQFSDGDENSEKEKLDRLIQLQVAGFIILPHLCSLSDQTLFDLVKQRRPVVFVDRTVEGLEYHSVQSDNQKGAYDMARHLLEVHGYKRITFVSWESTKVSSVKERFQGAKKACDELGGSLQLIQIDKSQIRDLRHTIKKSDAIFACTDLLAVEIISQLQTYDIRIPEDIAVVGFDDRPFSEFIQPKLTTVRQYPEKIGEKAAAVLISLLAWNNIEEQVHYIPTKLVVRNSCGCK